MPYIGNVTTSSNVNGSQINNGTITGDKLSLPFDYDSATLYLDNTNNRVGILTASPSSTLTVGTGGVVSIPLASAATPSLVFNTDTNTGIYSPGADQVAISTSGTPKILIGNGNPACTIHGQASAYPLTLDTTNVYGSVLTWQNSGTPYASAGAGAALVAGSNKDDLAINYNITNASRNLIVASNGTERLRITSAGLVGVGTSSPGEILAINGASNAEARLKIQNQTTTIGYLGSHLGIVGSGNANDLILSTGGATNLTFGINTVEKVRIDSSGRVGIGTSSPAYALHVSTTSVPAIGAFRALDVTSVGTAGQEIYFGALNGSTPTPGASITGRLDNPATTGDLAFSTRSGGTLSTRMFISSGGNVGIGSNSPGDFNQVVNAPHLVIGSGSTTSPGVTLYSTTAGSPILAFADGTTGNQQYRGYLQYDHTNDALISSASNYQRFDIAGSEGMRLDSSKRLLVGTSTARANFFNTTIPALSQVETSGEGLATASFTHNANSTTAPSIILAKTRGTAVGSTTIVQNGDGIGTIYFQGSDGTEFVEAASIQCLVDDTPGANDMPGRLAFSTTANGAAGATVRFTIACNGDHRFSNTNDVHPQPDNAVRLGFSGGRWSAVWAATGTIQTSDGRAKTEVTNAVLGSDFINSLRPVSYKWIEGGKRDTGERDPDGNWIYESVPGTRTHWGFIAQEVKEAVDAAGVDFGGYVLTDKDNPDSQQALRYDQFIAPLTKALQETMAELKALKAEVAALKAQ